MAPILRNGSERGRVIGVFDSGFGGLDILRGLVKILPEYHYLYLGDSLRNPYGTRSADEIYLFTRQAVEYLFTHGAEMVILACNSASSDALRRIQQEYLPVHHPTRRVLGVLIPMAEAAVAVTRVGRIGVLGTEATVRSGAFIREIHKLAPESELFQQAAPDLVTMIELGIYPPSPIRGFGGMSPEGVSGTTELSVGFQDTLAVENAIRSVLAPLLAEKIDTLILGCTHFGFLASEFRRILGPRVAVIAGSTVVPQKLADYLNRHPKIDQRLERNSKQIILTTGDPVKFSRLGSILFGSKLQAQFVELLS